MSAASSIRASTIEASASVGSGDHSSQSGSTDPYADTTPLVETRYLGRLQQTKADAYLDNLKPSNDTQISCALAEGVPRASAAEPGSENPFDKSEGFLNRSETQDAQLLQFSSSSPEISYNGHSFKPFVAFATPLLRGDHPYSPKPCPYRTIIYNKPDSRRTCQALSTVTTISAPEFEHEDEDEDEDEDKDEDKPERWQMTYKASEETDAQRFLVAPLKPTAVRTLDNDGGSAVYWTTEVERKHNIAFHRAVERYPSLKVPRVKGSVDIRSKNLPVSDPKSKEVLEMSQLGHFRLQKK